ncbi:hypothetical protein K439DRAFT_322844 [Ramaria rubella]|nr:hypothetical protein K439DRAFT_322844 [Ramaria rubella]
MSNLNDEKKTISRAWSNYNILKSFGGYHRFMRFWGLQTGQEDETSETLNAFREAGADSDGWTSTEAELQSISSLHGGESEDDRSISSQSSSQSSSDSKSDTDTESTVAHSDSSNGENFIFPGSYHKPKSMRYASRERYYDATGRGNIYSSPYDQSDEEDVDFEDETYSHATGDDERWNFERNIYNGQNDRSDATESDASDTSLESDMSNSDLDDSDDDGDDEEDDD